MNSLVALAPVIDVVTGTDWASVVASIATGVAALIGIGGTAYLAKRASADAKRNLKAASDEAKANREAASGDLQANIKAATEQLVTSINVEDRRARIAEKRRIYASVLAALNGVTIAASSYRAARLGDDDEERKVAVSRQTKAQEGMFQAIGELMLIAPSVVAGNAIALQNTLVEFMRASDAGAPLTGPGPEAIAGVRNALLRTMRVDLGEPVDIPEQTGPAQGLPNT